VKLLLFADGSVGAAVLRFLLSSFPEDVAAVVTTGKNDIHDSAVEAGIRTDIFHDTDTLHEKLSLSPDGFDLGLLAWWPRIIKLPLIDLPVHGWINFHPSYLPYNRGKHYNFWALVEEAPFGVTLHFIDEGVDSGDVVCQKTIPYDWTDTGESLYIKAQEAIVKLFKEQYPAIRTLTIPRTPQDLSEGSFHKASELDEASRIDLDGTYRGRDILNMLRARTFKGHPACWFEDGGETFEARIEIKRKK
jgi:methionyl-tRNA formyltransferase